MLNADLPASSRGQTGRDAGSEREFKFSDHDFRAIATILREMAGINLPDGKAPLVYARLVKRLRLLRLSSFAEYVELLGQPSAEEERGHMLAALTTNVTRFFREPHHFDHLRSQVLAPLVQSRKLTRLRLWSSACSTGQEPYSMAAVLAETVPNAAQLDVKILATDIDPNVLQRAREGRYDSIEGIPAASRRWFERDGDDWVVDPALQNLISFKALNLNASWPVKGPLDVIFCRNVAIYFDQDVQARLWSAFANVLRPGATFYIGHSERISGPATSLFDNVGITTYQRRGAA